MSHDLDENNGRYSIAFRGERKDIWHRHGQQKQAGESIESWAKDAGLDWEAIRTPAFHQLPSGAFEAIPGWSYMTRNDTLKPIGYVSDASYKPVQPREVLDWFQRYISVDDRFGLDVAGALDGGRKIWATATYNGDVEVAGSAHRARLLMSTSFDGSQATINKATMTRVVCQNTLSAALADKKSEVRTFHNARFDAAVVGKQLSAIAQGFAKFKEIGDAMALVEFSAAETVLLFKKLLDIDPAAKSDDMSTRKLNQFLSLSEAYSATEKEGTESGKVWTALNAVTRYVDHSRSSRNGDSPDSARFDSALFGSGARMKEQAFGLLLPLIKDRVAA